MNRPQNLGKQFSVLLLELMCIVKEVAGRQSISDDVFLNNQSEKEHKD